MKVLSIALGLALLLMASSPAYAAERIKLPPQGEIVGKSAHMTLLYECDPRPGNTYIWMYGNQYIDGVFWADGGDDDFLVTCDGKPHRIAVFTHPDISYTGDDAFVPGVISIRAFLVNDLLGGFIYSADRNIRFR